MEKLEIKIPNILFTNPVGSSYCEQLVNRRKGRLEYWRQGGSVLDYVQQMEYSSLGIEVSSGKRHGHHGTGAFFEKYPGIPVIMIGSEGLPLKSI